MKKIRVLLLNCAKANPSFMKFLRKCMFIVDRTKYLLFYFGRVNNKRVLFESFMGKKYVDSPKAIYEYMLKDPKYKDYQFVWFFTNPENYKFLENNKNTKVYKYKSLKYFKMYAISKFWITNSRVSDVIIKKSNQVYVQCWHGTPLKRLGFDIKVAGGNAMNSIKDIQYKYKIDSKKYSYMVSPSKFTSDKYISAFDLKSVGKENIIIEKGYPRNDFLCTFTDKDVSRIKKELNIPKNKKIILYAPTWRDNQHTSGVGYTYETVLDFDKLKEEIGDEYVILFRAHYFVANSFDFSKYEGFVYNVCNYDDINDLYIISDALITDYSSVFFDYSILKRPMLFYMYDLKEYKEDIRDFYFDIKELPGPIVEIQEDLFKEIKKINNFKYSKKYQDFNNKYTYLDDGNSAKRVCDVIFK